VLLITSQQGGEDMGQRSVAETERILKTEYFFFEKKNHFPSFELARPEYCYKAVD
jgi:hypothetical protein